MFYKINVGQIDNWRSAMSLTFLTQAGYNTQSLCAIDLHTQKFRGFKHYFYYAVIIVIETLQYIAHVLLVEYDIADLQDTQFFVFLKEYQ
jgi:hypothetical protein